MKYRWSFLLYLLAFLLQGNLANLLTIGGTAPNLILCLTVIFAFLYDDQFHAIIFGTLFGLFADLCFYDIAGVSALGYLLLSILIFFVGGNINKEHVLSIVALGAVSTVLFEGWRFTVFRILGSGQAFISLLRALPLMIIVNIICCAVIYFIIFGLVIRRNQKFYYGRHIY